MLLLDLLPELVHIEDARVPGPAPPLLLLRHGVDKVGVSLPVLVILTPQVLGNYGWHVSVILREGLVTCYQLT